MFILLVLKESIHECALTSEKMYILFHAQLLEEVQKWKKKVYSIMEKKMTIAICFSVP